METFIATQREKQTVQKQNDNAHLSLLLDKTVFTIKVY